VLTSSDQVDNLRTKQYIGQEKALEFFIDGVERSDRLGTLFNMAMGTGKSRAAIECMKYMEGMARAADRTLVVIIACPVALLPEPRALNPGGWAGQLKKWWAEQEGSESFVSYMERKGTTSSRATDISSLCQQHAGVMFGTPLVIAQSYESWRQPALSKLLSSIGATERFLKFLICDESHKCKTPSSATTKNMIKFADKCDQRLLLTGTPMPHTPMDIWSQARICEVRAYGSSFYAFRGRYANMRTLEGHVQLFTGMKKERLPEFKEKMNTFTYTLSVEDALDLPPLTHNTIHVSMSKAEQKAYDDMKKKLIVEFNDAVNEDDKNTISAPNVLSQISKLSQITGGSIKDEAGNIVDIGDSKVNVIKDMLENDIPADEPVVIFTRYKADIDKCMKAVTDTGRVAYELSGRKKELEKWRAAQGGEVIVVQEAAGGTGVELQRAHHVIYYSVSYSLGDFEQSVARLHRAGQEFPVSAVHLVCPGTIDEVIRDSITSKRNMVNAALGYLGVNIEDIVHEEGSTYGAFGTGSDAGLFDDD
jgi:hypothetical protein